jgi:hypothetical protein
VRRDGPQRRTQSSALGSVRSPTPPGQQCERSRALSRSVSSMVRDSIDSTIEGTDGSGAGPSTGLCYPIGTPPNRLDVCQAVCGTFEMTSW